MTEVHQLQLAATPTEGAAYLTTEEAAAIARCDPKTIRRAIGNGRLRAFQPAHKMLLLESDVHAWVQGEAVTTTKTRAPRSDPARGRRRPAPGSVESLREMERNLGS